MKTSPKPLKDFLPVPLKCVVIGASAGGLQALDILLRKFPASFGARVLIVHHIHPSSGMGELSLLQAKCACGMIIPEDKEMTQPGTVYLAPADYHMLVSDDESICLSVDEKVHYSRPSIDLLFSSAASVYGRDLLGIILTGASVDGTDGIIDIFRYGGMTIAQDPRTAEAGFMPKSAIDSGCIHYLGTLEEIALALSASLKLAEPKRSHL